VILEKTGRDRKNVADLQAPIVKITQGLCWTVFEPDDFQTIPASIVGFLRLVEMLSNPITCHDLPLV
jgi:hypothetical protein